MRVAAHADKATSADRPLHAGFVFKKGLECGLVHPATVAIGSQTGVAGGERLLLATDKPRDYSLRLERLAPVIESARVLDFDLSAPLPHIEVRHDVAQHGPCRVRVERRIGDPQAALIVDQPCTEIRHQQITQIFGRPIKVADVTSPREGRQRRDTRGRMVGRRMFLHGANVAETPEIQKDKGASADCAISNLEANGNNIGSLRFLLMDRVETMPYWLPVSLLGSARSASVFDPVPGTSTALRHFNDA